MPPLRLDFWAEVLSPEPLKPQKGDTVSSTACVLTSTSHVDRCYSYSVMKASSSTLHVPPSPSCQSMLSMPSLLPELPPSSTQPSRMLPTSSSSSFWVLSSFFATMQLPAKPCANPTAEQGCPDTGLRNPLRARYRSATICKYVDNEAHDSMMLCVPQQKQSMKHL